MLHSTLRPKANQSIPDNCQGRVIRHRKRVGNRSGRSGREGRRVNSSQWVIKVSDLAPRDVQSSKRGRAFGSQGA